MKIQYITTKNKIKITCPSDHNQHSNNIRSTNKTNQIAAQFVRRSIWRMGGRVYFSNSFLRNHHDFIGFALHCIEISMQIEAIFIVLSTGLFFYIYGIESNTNISENKTKIHFRWSFNALRRVHKKWRACDFVYCFTHLQTHWAQQHAISIWIENLTKSSTWILCLRFAKCLLFLFCQRFSIHVNLMREFTSWIGEFCCNFVDIA